MKIEHKLSGGKLEIKADGDGPGSIKGYASTFGNRDRSGDIIVKGAFLDDLEEFIQNGVILARHGSETTQPIATITRATEDDHGLWLEADFHSTELAQQERTIAQERIARGKSASFSIGYTPKAGGVEYTKDARLLKKIKLWETSLVNIPANEQALVGGVKEMHDKQGTKKIDVKGAFEDALADRTNSPWNLWDTFMCVYCQIQMQDEAAESLGMTYDFAGAIQEAVGEFAARLTASIIEADQEEDASDDQDSVSQGLMGDMALMGLGLSLADGKSYGDHLRAVADAAQGLLRRTEGRVDMRVKEGRMLSSQNESMLSDLADTLDVHAGKIRKLLETNAKVEKGQPVTDMDLELKLKLALATFNMQAR